MSAGKSKIRLGLISLGFIFLFNPILNVIDVLPDFFGYLLLAAGVYSMSFVSPHMEEARSGFFKLAVVSLARCLCILFVFGVAVESERDSLMLLLSFALAVIEMILLIPAWKAFFDSFFYMGELDGRIRLAKTKAFTLFFMCFKSIMAFLPESSQMTVNEKDDGLYEFIGLFRITSIAITLAVGIVWLVIILKFIRIIKREKAYISHIQTRFETEILPHTEIFIKREVKTGFVLLGIGLALSVDVMINYKSVLPDLFAAVFLIAGLAILGKHTKKITPAVIVTAVWGIVSLSLEAYSIYFIAKFNDPMSALRSAEAYDAYPIMMILGISDAVLSAVSLALICRHVYKIIKNHTGYSMQIAGSYNPDAKKKEIIKSLGRELLVGVCLIPISCAAEIVYYIFLPNSADGFFGAMQFIRIIIDMSTAALVCRALYHTEKEVEYKYMLD